MFSVLLFCECSLKEKKCPVKPLAQERVQVVRSGLNLAQPALVSGIDTACIGSPVANSFMEGSALPGEGQSAPG